MREYTNEKKIQKNKKKQARVKINKKLKFSNRQLFKLLYLLKKKTEKIYGN